MQQEREERTDVMSKKQSIAAGVALALAAATATAGSVNSASLDLTLGGGLTGEYVVGSNVGASASDSITVSDFLVEASGSVADFLDVTAGYGALGQYSLASTTVPGSPASPVGIGLQYGWATLKPAAGLELQAGMLATNIGYEVAPTYANAHIQLGTVWNYQPVYYPGIRATYDAGTFSLYAEASKDSGGFNTSRSNPNAQAVGISGELAGWSYAASYYNRINDMDTVDLILSGKLSGLDVAVNLDYHLLDDAAKTAGQDDTALAVALYASQDLGEGWSLPVRLEYLSDGTSTILGGVDSAFTVTVTPTYRKGPAFVRAEVAYVSASNKVFTDDSGVAQDTKTTFAVQAGTTF